MVKCMSIDLILSSAMCSCGIEMVTSWRRDMLQENGLTCHLFFGTKMCQMSATCRRHVFDDIRHVAVRDAMRVSEDILDVDIASLDSEHHFKCHP